jgi:hypothetical protein
MNKIEGNNFGKIENEHVIPYLEHGLFITVYTFKIYKVKLPAWSRTFCYILTPIITFSDETLLFLLICI